MALKSSETNVLITTKSGHEIPLHLVSEAKVQGGEVDFFLDYERPHSFLIPATASSSTVGETKTASAEAPAIDQPPSGVTEAAQNELLKQIRVTTPIWEGKQLRVAIGRVSESGQPTTVSYSVLNNSGAAIDLLPPQVQLSGASKEQHGSKAKAEPIPIDDYSVTFVG